MGRNISNNVMIYFFLVSMVASSGKGMGLVSCGGGGT